MEAEKGHDYIRKTASFIRNHEHHISHVVKPRRPHEPSSLWNWFSFPTGNRAASSLIFTNDPHHLFYLLIKIEALGINVGSLDVRIENLSESMHNPYVPRTIQKDMSDTMSISSLRSAMSSVSMFSLGGGWFQSRESLTVDSELKYLYSVFTRLPALRLEPPKGKPLAELVDDPPSDSAIPMDSFKNLQILECDDIDPRILVGWDLLCQSLRSLTIKRSGVEDIPELLVNLVIEDKARRETGGRTRVIRPGLMHKPDSNTSSVEGLKTFSSLSESVRIEGDFDVSLGQSLPPHAWSSLTHLCLADNNLTFILSFLHLPSLRSLDLSNNLLVSVPPCLSSLSRLKSLNISNNMIDSVLGVYSQIPSVESLNISSNRLESLCGLERLERLSRIDLRDNQVQDPDEVGRLAVVTVIKEVWVGGNPFTKTVSNWRVRCFDLFAKEQKEILLDGYLPGLLEKSQMSYAVSKGSQSSGRDDRPPSQFNSMRAKPVETPSSTVALGSTDSEPNPNPVPSSSIPSNDVIPESPQGKRRRRRFVDLGDQDKPEAAPSSPRRMKLHMRYSSELSPSDGKSSRSEFGKLQSNAEDPTSIPSDAFQGQAALASTISRASGKRWSRNSASTYEGIPDGEKLRKRMEELRNDVGDSWLKVLSQTQLSSTGSNKTNSQVLSD